MVPGLWNRDSLYLKGEVKVLRNALELVQEAESFYSQVGAMAFTV